jgi:EAL domain-containing protein (putative c-di-GMP-specific phosphodiesterase class I)
VVGEGVETAVQLDLLRSQGCDVVQGFHIARPMPLADLLAWPGPS